MRRLIIVAALLLCGGRALAQPAAALGHPLPAPELPAGTVTVRVIAGSPQNPVAGTDVTLSVNNTPRVARTDAAGRANFPGLTIGATVQAKVVADGAETASDAFSVPEAGGMRVMLSTKPFQPGAGGAPFAGGDGGGGAMPEPRQISGQPRAEHGDPAGTLTVLVTYDKLIDPNPAAGIPVTLVGYSSDDAVHVTTRPTGVDGRVKFDHLDVTGATAYYAMAQLPRNGSVDRVYSQPILVGSESGIRMLLSGDKRDATSPAVDDLTALERDTNDVPAGKVRVVVDSGPGFAGTIDLIDAQTMTAIAHAPATVDAGNAEVQASAQVEDNLALPAGTLDVQIGGGQGSDLEPMPDITVTVVPTDAKKVTDKVTGTTTATGEARIVAAPSKSVQAVFTIRGRQLLSKPFDLSKHGATITIRAHWDGGRPQAMLELAVTPGQVVIAQTTVKGTTYRSLPFQPLPDRGTAVTLYVFPRNLMTFRLFAGIEDQLLAVQGQMKIENFSWAPFQASADGLEIPLPKGFKGAIVANNSQEVAAVDQAIGFRIMRPIPPMGAAFECGFSLPVDGGDVHWAWDLPWGAYGSTMQFVEFPGMQVDLPPSVQGEHRESAAGGHFFVLPQISIAQNHAMVLTVRGLPSQPAWKLWAPRIVGLAALALMAVGLVFGVFGADSRSVPAVVILSIITFGFFATYWYVRTKRDMNEAGANIPSAWWLLVPFGNIWWIWQWAGGVAIATNGKQSQPAAFFLVFGLSFVGLGVVGAGIVQHALNQVDGLGGRTTATKAAKPSAEAAKVRAARRTKLMDELVALEQTGSSMSSKRREAVLAELEELWEQS